MTVTELTLGTFEEEIVNSGLPVIIDFYADWCGPCQMLKPIFAAVSEEYSERLKFMKLNTQSEDGLAAKFGIQGIPALVIVDNGKEVGRIIGYMGEDQLKVKIDEVLGRL